MTDSIDPIFLNLIYVIVGGIITLLFMKFGCRLLSHIVTFDIQEQLSKGNIAVGMMVMGMLIGIGIALGLVIGLGLN